MNHCSKCFNNDWDIVAVDGYMVCTCQQCANEVEFEQKARRNKPRPMAEGDKCRKCEGRIKVRECRFKPSKLKKKYYFTARYQCGKCRTFFMSEKFKVFNTPGGNTK